jgi:hypothetical protein
MGRRKKMRLIDADVEIMKLNQEIDKYTTKIKRLEILKQEEPNNRYNDWDSEISQEKRNIIYCKGEIKTLQNYATAYDVDNIVEQLKESDLHIDQEKCITVEDAVKIVKGGL